MKTICGIYFYIDLKEDEIVYVGQSTNIYKRHRGHLAPSSYDGQPINRIIQNDPVRYILEIERRCLPDELNDLEKMYIELLQPKFNFTSGGDYIPPIKKSKYTLWDKTYILYEKNDMYKKNRVPNPCRCFRIVYKSYKVNIGRFHDFITCQIINQFIKEEEEYEIKQIVS